MPVITGSTRDVARGRASRVTFQCLGHHESSVSGGVVSLRSVTVNPVNGVAVAEVGNNTLYTGTHSIPEGATVELWSFNNLNFAASRTVSEGAYVTID